MISRFRGKLCKEPARLLWLRRFASFGVDFPLSNGKERGMIREKCHGEEI